MDEIKDIFDIDRDGNLDERESALLQTYLDEVERRKQAEAANAMEPDENDYSSEKPIDGLAMLEEEFRRQVEG